LEAFFDKIRGGGKIMKINDKRFVLWQIGGGKRGHIFPKNNLGKALCLRGPAGTESLPDDEICKDCAKEYPIVARSPVFATFMG